MSVMIRCDKCKRTMFADSRSSKDEYAKVQTDYIDGYSTYHLCKICFRQFLTEFMGSWTPKEFDEMCGE